MGSTFLGVTNKWLLSCIDDSEDMHKAAQNFFKICQYLCYFQ